MFEFLSRQPFAILGAIGLVSLADVAMEFPSYIQDWIHIWNSVTTTAWGFILGWISITLSSFQIDYFSLGLVFSGAIFRSGAFKEIRHTNDSVYEVVLVALMAVSFYVTLWPLMILLWLFELFGFVKHDNNYEMSLAYNPVFYESFIYTLLIIAASYVVMAAA